MTQYNNTNNLLIIITFYHVRIIISLASIAYFFVRNTEVLEGEIPSPINSPTGYAFHTRCRQQK